MFVLLHYLYQKHSYRCTSMQVASLQDQLQDAKIARDRQLTSHKLSTSRYVDSSKFRIQATQWQLKSHEKPVWICSWVPLPRSQIQASHLQWHFLQPCCTMNLSLYPAFINMHQCLLSLAEKFKWNLRRKLWFIHIIILPLGIDRPNRNLLPYSDRMRKLIQPFLPAKQPYTVPLSKNKFLQD